jgi:hypothetical protein
MNTTHWKPKSINIAAKNRPKARTGCREFYRGVITRIEI